MANLASLPSSDVIQLTRSGDTKVLVHLFGATVLSWKCKGKEVLFVSGSAVFDNKKAIRGGIPIVFPNFGPWDLGPQHGFARIKRWKVEKQPAKNEAGDIVASLALEDDDETKKMWPHKFKVVYTLTLGESTFSMGLDIKNTGSDSWDFTCLLHTYLGLPDVSQTAVRGLQGLTFVDKVKNSATLKEDRAAFTVGENYDRVYQKAPSQVEVTHVADGKHDVVLKTSNFPDIVVWNPWAEKAKAMADFGDQEYQKMLCVEAGRVSERVALTAGQSYQCSQTLAVRPTAHV